jgi:hypothetical protein
LSVGRGVATTETDLVEAQNRGHVWETLKTLKTSVSIASLLPFSPRYPSKNLESLLRKATDCVIYSNLLIHSARSSFYGFACLSEKSTPASASAFAAARDSARGLGTTGHNGLASNIQVGEPWGDHAAIDQPTNDTGRLRTSFTAEV